MTVQYYAKSLLNVIRNIICRRDLEEFLKKPPEQQNLVEAFALFEQWENKDLRPIFSEVQ